MARRYGYDSQSAEDIARRRLPGRHIGEAANNIKRLDPGLEKESPALWPHLSAVYEMRIKLTHGYRSIDALIVWNTAKIDLPLLDQLIARAITGHG